MVGDEIFIPEINNEFGRRYSFSTWHRDALRAVLEVGHITPSSHPRVIDICAGDGAMAAHLIDLGWSDVVCLDQCVSLEPLVADVTWIYGDVVSLFYALQYGGPSEIPDAFRSYRHRFDLAIIAAPGIILDDFDDVVGSYFIRRGGYVSKW